MERIVKGLWLPLAFVVVLAFAVGLFPSQSYGAVAAAEGQQVQSTLALQSGDAEDGLVSDYYNSENWKNYNFYADPNYPGMIFPRVQTWTWGSTGFINLADSCDVNQVGIARDNYGVAYPALSVTDKSGRPLAGTSSWNDRAGKDFYIKYWKHDLIRTKNGTPWGGTLKGLNYIGVWGVKSVKYVIVEITGINKYKGQFYMAFPVDSALFNKTSIVGAKVWGIDNPVYTGSVPTFPKLKVMLGSTTLRRDIDYRVAADRKLPGMGNVVITGIGSYINSLTKTYTISKASLATAKVNFKNIVYNGAFQRPVPEVKLDGTSVPRESFMIEYTDNRDAGTAHAKITGLGNYEGTVEEDFEIAPRDIAKATASKIDALVYNGKARTPTVTLKFGSDRLVRDVDYTIEYSDNVDAGVGTIHVEGIGNYTGSRDIPFTIKKASLANATIRNIVNCVWDGTAQTQIPQVILSGLELVEGARNKVGADYWVEYKNNVNVGSASMTVYGQGNYQGSKTVKFAIAKEGSLESTVASDLPTYTYNGKERSPKPALYTANGKKLRNGTDYTIASYKNNKNAGTATVTLRGKGKYKGTKYVYFDIQPANISSASISGVKNKTYNGRLQLQSPTLKAFGITLKNGVGYRLTYDNNMDVGVANMIVTGSGNFEGERTVPFKINAAANPIKVVANNKSVQGKKYKVGKKTTVKTASSATFPTAVVVSKAAGAVTFSKASGAQSLSVNSRTGAVTLAAGTAKGTYRAKVNVHANGDAGYAPADKAVTVQVTVKG